MFVKPRDVEETVDMYRNFKGYNALLQLVSLWYIRLRHLSLNLFKKTVKITSDMPNLDAVKEEDFVCLVCDRNKAVRKFNLRVLLNPLKILDILKGDIFKVKSKLYNKRPIGLFIIDRKSRFRWVILLLNRQGPIVFNVIQGLFNGFKNRNYRYPTRFHFDNGNEINSLLQTWFQTIGISFNTSALYIYKQNGLIERSVRVFIDCLRAMLQWAGLFHFLWCFVIQTVFELINCIIVTNRDLTFYQLFYDKLKPTIVSYRSDLKAYKVIRLYCEVLIPLKKRSKAYKVKAKTEPGRLLAVLRSKIYLVYIPIRNTMIKTPFIKLYEPKNPLTLEGVSKPIGIRPLNDVAVTKDFTGEKVSLDLSEIDDIGSSESITLEALRPLELPALGPFKPSKPENRPLEPVFRLPEEPIKPVDSLDPDEMQLDLVISLCYRVKVKIFKKKLDKNSATPNMYK